MPPRRSSTLAPDVPRRRACAARSSKTCCEEVDVRAATERVALGARGKDRAAALRPVKGDAQVLNGRDGHADIVLHGLRGGRRAHPPRWPAGLMSIKLLSFV